MKLLSLIVICFSIQHVVAQKCYIIERDTITLFTLLISEDSKYNEVEIYSYFIHESKVYSADRYLKSRNDGCFDTSLNHIDNNC
jgi:hypothetical protein